VSPNSLTPWKNILYIIHSKLDTCEIHKIWYFTCFLYIETLGMCIGNMVNSPILSDVSIIPSETSVLKTTQFLLVFWEHSCLLPAVFTVAFSCNATLITSSFEYKNQHLKWVTSQMLLHFTYSLFLPFVLVGLYRIPTLFDT
jgi:hypothetical protein